MAFEAIKAGFAVFQRGKAVANPETWRRRSIAIQAVLGLLVAIVGLLRANGYDLPVEDEDLHLLATGLVSLWFGGVGVYRVVTSPDRGLPSRRPAGVGANDDEGG